MKLKKGESVLVVNSEEILALKNLVEQHRAEIGILRVNANNLVDIVVDLEKQLRSLKQDFVLLKSFVDKNMRRR
jgi:hypothetical protein